ncbi:MAG: hypothetical protein AAFV19_17205 [Pseudomonadota bacterium]
MMDEFWQFGQSKHLFDEFFHTKWPGKAVGYAVFYKLSHWAGWDAQSMLLIGRLQTALLTCGLLVIIYRIARSMDEPAVFAVLVVLVMLCFSTFIERSFRLRSEPLAVFFAAAALWACVSREVLPWHRIVLAGVLCGLSVLATQKAAYFCLALGVALVASALADRSLRGACQHGALLVLGWALPIVIYCVAFRPDNPLLVAENLVRGPVEVAVSGHQFYSDLRVFVTQTVMRNLPLYALCGLGLAVSLWRWSKLTTRQRITAVFTLIVSALVFSHTQPWPYVFIMAIPFLALWALVPLRLLANRPVLKSLSLAFGIVVVATSFVRNGTYLSHDNSHQVALMRQVEELLDTGETYFDGSGMLPNRRQSVEHWLDARWVWRTTSEGSNSKVYRDLAASPPKVLIDSYRLSAVSDALGPVLKDRYIGIAPNIRIVGRKIHPEHSTVFDVPVAGAYRLYDEAGAPQTDALEIDGKLQIPPFQLQPGKTTVLLEAPAPMYLLPDNLPFAPSPSTYTVTPVYVDVYSF